MYYVFLLLFIGVLIIFTIGIINPESLKNKKTGESPTRGKVAKVCAILGIVFLFAMGAFYDAVNFDISKACKYEIFKERDTSFSGRKRASVFIISKNARSFDERAQTAMKAAIDYQKKNSYNFVSVFLEADKRIAYTGNSLAIANYSPDGGGISGDGKDTIWDVKSVKDKIDPLAFKIRVLWEVNKNKFKNKDGFTDEKKLDSFINKELNLKKAPHLLLWYPSREPYNVKKI